MSAPDGIMASPACAISEVTLSLCCYCNRALKSETVNDLESSKNRRSASWHGNQYVRLRGAQVINPRDICPAPGAHPCLAWSRLVSQRLRFSDLRSGSSQGFKVLKSSAAVLAHEKIGQHSIVVAQTAMAGQKVLLSKRSK